MKVQLIYIYLLFQIPLTASSQTVFNCDKTNSDSTLFPYLAYSKVLSYSFNRDSLYLLEIQKQSDSCKMAFPKNPRTEEKLKAWNNDCGEIVNNASSGLERSIINKDLVLSPSAVKHKELDSTDLLTLDTIWTGKEFYDELFCLPEHHDAIVFFDKKNKPIAWINICFQCMKMESGPKKLSPENIAWKELEFLFRENFEHDIPIRKRK